MTEGVSAVSLLAMPDPSDDDSEHSEDRTVHPHPHPHPPRPGRSASDSTPEPTEKSEPKSGKPPTPITPRLPIRRDTLDSRLEQARGGEFTPTLGRRYRELWDIQAERAALQVREYRALAGLWMVDPDARGAAVGDGAEIEAARAGVAMRDTVQRAERRIENGHRAVVGFPQLLDQLEIGALTVEMFEYVLRVSDRLTIESLNSADELMQEWDFGMSPDSFRREVRLLVRYLMSLEEQAAETAEAPAYSVRVEGPDPQAPGSMSIVMTGEIPEMLGFSKRLDEAARAVKKAQVRALKENRDIPFDPDGEVARTGEPMTMDEIRGRLAATAEFSTDGVDINRDRFRLNILVPMMTLAGRSQLPATIDGITPIPADYARELAAGHDTWYRLLTDPATGAIAPVAPTRYTPSAAMLEHLRTRNPVCAFPGCSKRTHKVSEADHIIEFDHEDPHRGGRTELDNLHLLCRRHHQLKTAKHCRPSRRAESRRHPSAGSGITDWDLGGGVRVSVPQDRDLLTAALTTTIWKAWEAEQYRTGKKIGPVPPPPKPPESRTPEQPERHAPAEENSEAEPTEQAKKTKPAKPKDRGKPTEGATPPKRARRTPVPPEELGPPPF